MDSSAPLSAPPMANPGHGYDPSCFDSLARIEDRHFWFRARTRLIATLAGQITSGWGDGYRALEVGCGTGNVLRALQDVCGGGKLFGMDLFSEGLRYARTRSACPLLQAHLHNPPFAVGFQLVGLFDVLEHLPEDLAALRDLHNLLTPGGVLLLTVPAHPSLWSYFDELSHHCRRYTRTELEQKLVQAGFRIEFLTPYMACILPLVWLGRRLVALRKRPAQSPAEVARCDLKVMPVINAALNWMLSHETSWIARGRRLPFGTSLLAVARRPATP